MWSRRLAALTLCWGILTGSNAISPNNSKRVSAEMLTHYPTKRSALVPTLLYAQDEVGYLSA